MKEKLAVFSVQLKTWLLILMAKIRQKFADLKMAMKGKRFWYRVVVAMLICFVAGYMAILVVFAWFSKDLPAPNKVVRREGFSSRIYDRNGELLYDVYKDAKSIPVTWEDIPESLKNATVAVEDKSFFQHGGVDFLTPFRIVKNRIVMGRWTGGSTLTQQLVKNVLLTSERTLSRKIKEFILAVQIEAKYKKSEILLMYLNEAPYGGATRGVGMAAEQYFGKPVKSLTLTEAAILAGLPQRPNVYSPFSKTPTAYVDRTAHVLERMREDGYINEEMQQTTLAEAKVFKFNQNKSQLLAPHFIQWVKDQLSDKYGEDVIEGGGLKITTTLDLKLQNKVQEIVSDEVTKAEKLGISNGASIVIDPVNGQVLAMVGSRDYNNSDKTDGKFNVVTQGLRQPGSSIKPITYLTAIRRGYTAASMIMDAPVTFASTVPGQKDYSPQNYNGKFNGPMPLAAALGNSINTTAVKMLANVGLSNMLQQAYDMGLSTLEPTPENLRRFGLAVTLGGAEVKMIDLASAYGAFANGGSKIEPIGVLKVEDRSGRVLEEYRPIEGKRVMTPQEAFIISNILSNNDNRVITFGAVNGLIIPNYQVAVKTGTTNDKKDNWTIGWTPNLLTAVWVGNNNNTPMGKIASGVSGASPIWKKIMQYAIPSRPKQDFSIPDKIVDVEVDKISGYAAHDGFPSYHAYFIDGTQPRVNDPIHLKLKVCKDKAGIAPPEDVSNGNYNEKEFFKFNEDDPVSKDGKNRWQEGIDKWISEQADKDKYNPPTGFCRNDGTVSVGFDSPGDHATVGNDFDIRINTSSLKKITEVKIWANGNELKTLTDRPFEGSVHLEDGLYTLKVRATDSTGAGNEREIKIGVNKPWDWAPSPTPTPTGLPTPTEIPVTPTLEPTVAPTSVGTS